MNSSTTAMIVDFPASPRVLSHRPTGAICEKTVRFSSDIEGRYINYPSARDNRAKWYDDGDYARFQRVLVNTAVQCSDVLASVKNGQQDMTKFDMQAFVIYCVSDWIISFHVMCLNAIKQSKKQGRSMHVLFSRSKSGRGITRFVARRLLPT
jgi:hypothetical protein